MLGSGSSVFVNVDDYAASLPVAIRFCSYASEGFTARLTRVELPDFQLHRASETLPRRADVVLPPERVFLSFPATRGSVLTYAGRELKFGDIVFHSLGEGFLQCTVDACRWGLISLPPDRLLTFGRTLIEADILPPEEGALLEGRELAELKVQRLHARIIRLAETRIDSFLHPQIVRALEQELILTVVSCLGSGVSRS